MANVNNFIPPGSTSSYQAPFVDHQNVGQRLSNPNSINKRIEEARLQDNMRKQLMAEFNIIDVNQDGSITRDELHQFFINEKNIIDDEIRFKIVDEIFDQVDIDDNGVISVEEFIMKYIDTRNKLMERQEEVMRNIIDHSRQQDEVKIKLSEAMQTERQYMTSMGIRSDSKLKVHIVDAQNLEEGQHLVKLYQDQSFAETNVRIGSVPIWNEAIVFDIKDPYQNVIIQLINQRQEIVLEQNLDLNDAKIRDYSLQGEEIWLWAQVDENGFGIESGEKLRVRVHFSYSDVQRFESLLQEWQDYISEDIEEFELIKEYLENLTTPFGFMKSLSKQKAEELKEEDKEDLKEQNKGDTPYYIQEKVYEAQLDEAAKSIAASWGYRSVPWLDLTFFILVIQMILSMLTQFHRKDFVTMTVCSLGFYFLTFPENVRRSQFRMLVLLIAVSIAQDVAWFILSRDVEDDDDDGGVERSVKTFARKVSYVSFVWRILLAIILWKDSLDFITIVKNKSVDNEALSIDERVEQIIKEHHAGDQYGQNMDQFSNNQLHY